MHKKVLIGMRGYERSSFGDRNYFLLYKINSVTGKLPTGKMTRLAIIYR
jgi:hypothetical protein